MSTHNNNNNKVRRCVRTVNMRTRSATQQTSISVFPQMGAFRIRSCGNVQCHAKGIKDEKGRRGEDNINFGKRNVSNDEQLNAKFAHSIPIDFITFDGSK